MEFLFNACSYNGHSGDIWMMMSHLCQESILSELSLAPLILQWIYFLLVLGLPFVCSHIIYVYTWPYTPCITNIPHPILILHTKYLQLFLFIRCYLFANSFLNNNKDAYTIRTWTVAVRKVVELILVSFTTEPHIDSEVVDLAWR